MSKKTRKSNISFNISSNNEIDDNSDNDTEMSAQGSSSALGEDQTNKKTQDHQQLGFNGNASSKSKKPTNNNHNNDTDGGAHQYEQMVTSRPGNNNNTNTSSVRRNNNNSHHVNGSLYYEFVPQQQGKNYSSKSADSNRNEQEELPASPISVGGGSTSSHFTLRRAAIPLKEKFILNPWQKFKYYKRIPMKIFINLLTIIVLTVYIAGYFAADAIVVRNERFGLVQFFLPNAADNTAQSLIQTYASIDDAVTWIQSAASTYYTIPDESVGIWMHFADVPSWVPPKATHPSSDYIVRPPRLIIRLMKNFTQLYPEPRRFPDGKIDENYNIIDAWDYFGGGDESRDSATETLYFDLNESTNFMGPFDPNEITKYQDETTAYINQHLVRACSPQTAQGMDQPYLPCKGGSNLTDFFDRILDMELQMQIRGVRRVSSTDLASIVRWDMNFKIGFTAGRSLVEIKARFKPYSTNHFTALPMITLSILVVLYCGCVVLYVRALWRYRRSNTQLQEILDDLTAKERAQFREKLAGFSWRVFGLVCALTGITFCVLATLVMSSKSSDEDLRFWRDLFLGLTYFFQWLLLLSHFQTIPEYYSGIKTVAFAIPMLIQFTVGIFPLFIGFSILFYVCFGPFAVAQFGTFSNAMCALYSSSNGDSLLQFYTQISQAENWLMKTWARVIFTVFLLYFCGHAQNVIMGIVQDAYLRVNETFELNYWDDEKSDDDESSSSCDSTCSSSSSSSSSLSCSDDDDDAGNGDDDVEENENDGTKSVHSVKSSKSVATTTTSEQRAAKRLRRKERKMKRKQMGDLADPVVVSKLAKKLKKMRNQRRNVLQQIDQYYYLYDDDHHGIQ